MNSKDANFDRIILIDKPENMSSFGVVARVRRVLTEQANAIERAKNPENPNRRKIKVGHTGTLDPFATGLLILMTGKNTKLCQDFLKKDKEYLATLELGKTSTTGDPEGEIAKVSTKIPTKSEITAALKNLTGKIEQTVPKFSAVKVNGQRAYNLARKGEDIKMPTRTVEIYELELLEYNYPTLKIRTKVSSGTYIRALAEDLGRLLGTGAYLTALRRTKIANYSVDFAKTLADFGIDS